MKTIIFTGFCLLFIYPCFAQDSLSTAIARSSFHRIERDSDGGIKVELNNILIRDHTFYFTLRLENSSSIPYDIDFTRFYIRDLKTAKRTVTQEQEIYPECVYGKEVNTVPQNERLLRVFTLDRFTLPDDKALFIEVYEKGGARHLHLKADRSDIGHATVIH